ncbi:hypothetical protein FOA52_014989 [Chlamydomonas sp. UWO 241]|nr:hypothetical protein FOA52_014989 [Chlamydomonas sp. UWO 241]
MCLWLPPARRMGPMCTHLFGLRLRATSCEELRGAGTRTNYHDRTTNLDSGRLRH